MKHSNYHLCTNKEEPRIPEMCSHSQAQYERKAQYNILVIPNIERKILENKMLR